MKNFLISVLMVLVLVPCFGKYGAIYLSDHNPVYCDFVVKSR